MCDEHTLEDDARWSREHEGLSRRHFAKAGLAAAVALSLPRAADALAVTGTDVRVPTPDGEADAWFVHPTTGAHAAVLVWPDVLGLRPAYKTMGTRLAEAGYAVLVIHPYYRDARAPVVPEGASFRDPAIRERVLPYARALSATTTATDARAFVSWLDAQDAVDTSRGIGTTGYCMGGPMVLQAAATVPERIRAGATFHGSRMVTDADDSPHTLIPSMRGRYLIAIAENDDERQPEAKGVLRETFEGAGVPAEIEVYADAMHGWCALDSQVHHPEQAARAHWRLLETFRAALA